MVEWSDVLVAFITGTFAVMGQHIIAKRSRINNEVDAAKREQKQSDRLDQIEKKLDEHNNYASKIGAIERSVAVIQRDVEYLKKGVKL